jgi:hypothetical protein
MASEIGHSEQTPGPAQNSSPCLRSQAPATIDSPASHSKQGLKIARQVCRLIPLFGAYSNHERPIRPSAHPIITTRNRSRRHCLFATIPLLYIRLSGRDSGKKRKNVPRIRCKVYLTLLPSTKIFKNRGGKMKKNGQKRPEFDPFSAFSDLFRHLAPSPDHRLASALSQRWLPWHLRLPPPKSSSLPRALRESRRRQILEHQPRSLPQQPWRALGRSIQGLNVDRM